jgi:hypothetical protein
MEEKLLELEYVIGWDCSCNGSPTLRAKLISVDEEWCILEITPRVHSRDESKDVFIGNRVRVTTSYAYNLYYA